jgi:hypothetical protein
MPRPEQNDAIIDLPGFAPHQQISTDVMKVFLSLALLLLLVSSGYATREVKSKGPISLPSDIQRFIKDKKAEAHTMAVE